MKNGHLITGLLFLSNTHFVYFHRNLLMCFYIVVKPKTIQVNFMGNGYIQYGTTFKAEIKEEDGKKVVFLSGSLMNDKMNSNYWQVPMEELGAIAAQYTGSPVKVQHAVSDWEIIGSGVSANVVGNNISYIAKITDTRAVDKFVSGTWTAQNMGISPSVLPKVVECNICGKDLTKDAFACPHIVGETYGDKMAGIITKGNKMVESSLTSQPAYADMGAGNIEDVNALVASIQKIVKTEEKIMAEQTELEKKVAELETLSKELETSKAEIVTVKAELKKVEEEKKKKEEEKKKKEDVDDDEDDDKVKKVEKENAELKEDLETAKKEVAEFKNAVREAELSKLVKDETVVAEILKKEMTDDEFKAEVEIIKKVQTLSASANGSAPAENGSGSKDVFIEEFGASKDEIVKRLMGSTN